MLERKCHYRRAEIDIAGQCDEVARILPCHICNTAQLALAPQQFVVVECGHFVQVNGVDCNHSALAQGCQCTHYYLPARCESDGAIEHNRRFCIFVSNPCSAAALSGFAMTFAACEHIHLAVPGLQDTDGQRSGTPEAVKSHALSPLDSGDAQAA